MTSITSRVIDWLLVSRWWLLAAAILVAGLALAPSRRITYNRSIENMFAADDPVVQPYQHLKRVFGGNELVLAVYVDSELLAPNGRGIERLAQMSQRLAGIDGVRDVLSLDRPIGSLIVAPDNRVARQLRESFAGYTHSVDGQTAAVVCMLRPELAATGRLPETIAAIRAVMRDLPDGLAPGMIAGEPVLVEEGFTSLELDGRRLARWSTWLVAATILLIFRSVRWVILPLVVVQWTLLITSAILGATGLQLTLVSSMWSSIITVVGIATAVHLLVQYRELRTTIDCPREALRESAILVAAPIIWSLVTDAFGFGSLLCSRVGPVRDFGLMTALGSLLVLVSLALLMPGVALIGRWDTRPHRAWGEHGLSWMLEGVVRGVARWPRLIGLLTIAGTAWSLAGVGRLEVETDFTRNFRAGSPIVQSYEFIETRLGGAGVLDIVLPAPESLDWPYIARVLRLEQRLRAEVRVLNAEGREEPGLTKVLSAADTLVAASPTDPETIGLEVARNLVIRGGWEVMRTRMPAFASALYAADPDQPDQWWFRVMVRAKERQPADQKLRLIREIEQIVADELARPDWRELAASHARAGSNPAAVTGYFVLLTNLIASTVSDQWLSFALASLGVALVLFIALRRLRWVLVALVPNALPIFLVLGTLGWLHLKMNLGAAMIAAVSMGLSVDSSLHYLISFRRRRLAGDDVSTALASVQQSVGRAVVFSTLALVVGFTVLGSSEFVPTIYFGVLMSLAMLGGLAGNLVVLPLLIRLADGDASQRP